MEMISEDRWDDDIWGVEHPDPDFKDAIPKLVFYFGQKVSTNIHTFRETGELIVCRIIGLRTIQGTL